MNTFKQKFSVAILFVGSIVFLSSCGDEKHEATAKLEPIVVTVARASQRSSVGVTSSGQVVSVETAMISTRMMGFITAIKVKTGDRVRKGQLLVTISNGDILAKRAQAQAMVTESEAALKDAQLDYERYTELFKQQSASKKELENITLNFNSIKAKAEAARQMKNEAEAMLSYANLTSPIDGVVTQKNLDAGSMANPGVPILVVEQTGKLQVITSVTEADISAIRTGAPVQVRLESIGKTVTGKVSEVSPSSQNSGGQYGVKVALDAKEAEGLHAGMFASVMISTEGASTGSDAVTVPAAAIVHNDQLTGIYTVSESKTALLRWIKLGKQSGDQFEVLSGLRADEDFIIAAEGKLYNGHPVIVK